MEKTFMIWLPQKLPRANSVSFLKAAKTEVTKIRGGWAYGYNGHSPMMRSLTPRA